MNTENHAPWDNAHPIDQVIDSLRPELQRLELIEPGSGYTDTQLREAESRLGFPLPNDVRLFYKAAKPKRFELEDWPPVAFFRLDDEDVRWYDFAKDAPHPLDLILGPAIEQRDSGLTPWQNAKLFMLGGTPFFDRFFCLYDHPSHPNGTVLFTAHEDDRPLVFVAKSFSQYLQRLVHFEGIDQVFYPENEGLKEDDLDIDDLYLDALNENLWNPYAE